MPETTARPCCKIRHYSPANAYRHARELRWAGKDGNSPGRLHVYWCWACLAFHVGHTLRKETARG